MSSDNNAPDNSDPTTLKELIEELLKESSHERSLSGISAEYREEASWKPCRVKIITSYKKESTPILLKKITSIVRRHYSDIIDDIVTALKNAFIKVIAIKIPDISYIEYLISIIISEVQNKIGVVCFPDEDKYRYDYNDEYYYNISLLFDILAETDKPYKPGICKSDELTIYIDNKLVHFKEKEFIEYINALDERYKHTRICINKVIIFISYDDKIPQEYGSITYVAAIPYPDLGLIRKIVLEILKYYDVKSDNMDKVIDKISFELRGFSIGEIIKIITHLVQKNVPLREIPSKILGIKKRMFREENKDIDVNIIKPTITFNDCPGYTELKNILYKLIIEPFKRGEYDKIPRGILLVGIPGVGKSYCIEALAGELGNLVYIIRLDFASIGSAYYSESEQRLKRILERTEQMAPAIIFVDEAEQLFISREWTSRDTSTTNIRLANILLQYMGRRERKTVFIATTNYIELMDRAYLRPGRFEIIIVVNPPTPNDRREIIEYYIKKLGIKICREFNVEAVVNETDLWTPDELYNLLREVKREYEEKTVCTNEVLELVRKNQIDRKERLIQIMKILKTAKSIGGGNIVVVNEIDLEKYIRKYFKKEKEKEPLKSISI